MSAIRIAMVGILAIMAGLVPSTSHAAKNIVVLPIADYSTMDTLSSARQQSLIITDSLTKSLADKGMNTISPLKVFTSLQTHNCIELLVYNKELQPTSNTLHLKNELNNTLSTGMQNELKALITTEQKRMTPGLAIPDDHLPKPQTSLLNEKKIAAIGSELAGDYLLRGRILVKSIAKDQSRLLQLPTTPLRHSILPFFTTINQDEKYAIAAAGNYDLLDAIMLKGLFDTPNKQAVHMQLWAHDARTGRPVWSNITEVPFGTFRTGKTAAPAISKAAQFLINDFFTQVSVDFDGDGIFNVSDNCPNTPNGIAVNHDGCPKDNDLDTVADYQDQCPDTPQGVKVDTVGCPQDTDADTIPDYQDRCPDTPTGVSVDEKGCAKDSDADGIPDYRDKCANTPPTREVDNDGCPKPIYEKVAMELRIEFDFDKAEIRDIYHDHIQKVAHFMITYPETTATIEGHTDKEGSAEYNQKLSQRRAEAVRRYLIDNFQIAPERLTAQGYGESKPLGGNNNAQGRNPKNRRAVAVFSITVAK